MKREDSSLHTKKTRETIAQKSASFHANQLDYSDLSLSKVPLMNFFPGQQTFFVLFAQCRAHITIQF